MNETEKYKIAVGHVLLAVGISVAKKGYELLVEAIIIYGSEEGNHCMKKICEQIAEKKHMTAFAVERDMRTVIHDAEEHGLAKKINEFLDRKVEGAMTPKEFVALIAKYLHDDDKKPH